MDHAEKGGPQAMMLKGRTAIVTGGTRGIGRAIAERLLSEGVGVAICGRSGSAVKKSVVEMGHAGKGKICGIEVDVSKLDEVRRLFAFAARELGGLDILINNAGMLVLRSVAEMEPNDWQRSIETNLGGVFYCCHEALSLFRQRGGGFIINISSLLGKTAVAGGAAYCASKFGVNGFSEALLLDHRRENVGVCTILPGSVNTELFGTPADSNWKIQPEDVAQVVVSVLTMPSRTLMSRIEMRPLKPSK
jgi:3-oxoacyl-[acyl-carrier protein] reductase